MLDNKPTTVAEFLTRTDWVLLRDQKIYLIEIMMMRDIDDPKLGGLLDWLGALEAAARADGFLGPSSSLTEEEAAE